MRFSLLPSLLAGAAIARSSSALSIVLNNDDGFGAANIRELYRLLVADGHDVVMVAPAENQSGKGGTSVFTDSATLQRPSEYGIIPAGAPSVGTDPNDSNIWYYNGTPAACTFVALDWVIPHYYDNRTVDLFVSGPNFGNNLGPFVWTLSGTAGAAYSAVTRNIPSIAFSAGNSEQRSYKEVNATTPSGFADPATIAAQLSIKVIDALANNTKAGERLMPLGYGLNVNWASIDSMKNGSCVDPPFYQTRMTGGAVTDIAVRNATTGLFHYGSLLTEGINQCINGDCSLPGETEVVDGGCYGAISVFTVDYDAPQGLSDYRIRSKLEDVAAFADPLGAKKRRSLSKRAIEETHPLRHE